MNHALRGASRSAGHFAGRSAVAAVLATNPIEYSMATPPSPQKPVFAAERAFARSMADRNLAVFADHLSNGAIFFGGPTPLRGKAEVVTGWSRYFAEGAAAPFSWEPDRVEVSKSGALALGTGLVLATPPAA